VELLPPLLLGLPLLAAALIRVPAIWRHRRLSAAVGVAAAATVVVLGGVLAVAGTETPIVHWVGGWQPREGAVIGVALVADGLTAGFVSFAGVAVGSALWHAIGSYHRTDGLFEVLTLLLLVAFNGFVLSADLFSMFVFIELLGITVYALTASKVDDVAAVPGALNIAVTSTIGAVLFLSGATLVYGATGTPNLGLAGERLAAGALTPSVAVGVGLLVAGLAVKAGLAPFHFGHLDSHTVARVPHAGLFGAITVPAGLYGLARVQTLVVPGLGDAAALRPLLLGAAVLTAVVGGVLCLAQTHLKRLLACSSLAHVGIAAAGIALAVPAGLAGTAVYVAGHGSLKLGLFLAVGVVLHRLGSVEVGELVGRAGGARLASVLLLVGGPLLAGMPPSGLFAGKAIIAEAASDAGVGWVVPVLYLVAAATGVALVRAAVHLWWGWPLAPDRVGRIGEGSPETDGSSDEERPAFVLVPPLLVLGSVAVLLAPGLLGGVGVATTTFTDPAAHLAALGSSLPSGSIGTLGPPVGELEVWKRSSLAWGTGAAALSVVAGVATARWGRREANGLLATIGHPARFLRELHSGHIGDYTAWATLGAGATCAWVLFSLVPDS
jgi:multicomponent Na+:H+ antiporter subunit D